MQLLIAPSHWNKLGGSSRGIKSCVAARSPARQIRTKTLPDQLPHRWEPDRTPRTPGWPVPALSIALGRGLRGRCPACGLTPIFHGYLRVVDACPHCGAPLGRARADDAPPYFTILVVGHLVIPSMLVLERAESPPTWVQTVIWVPVTLALSLLLLRPIKGATVGLMLKLGMMKPDDEG
jgi:uncharacterized protein (DUF983 family)